MKTDEMYMTHRSSELIHMLYALLLSPALILAV